MAVATLACIPAHSAGLVESPDSTNLESTAIIPSGEPDKERAAALEHMLLHDCGSCHGLTLSGGLGSPLTVDSLKEKSSAYLFAAISQGIPGTPMPAWSGLLDDQDIHWLVARLLNGAESP